MKKTAFLLAFMFLFFLLSSCGNASFEIGTLSHKPSVPDRHSEPLGKVEFSVSQISFLGCGDNIVYFGTVRDAKRNAVEGGRDYNFKPIYENVADIIKEADVSFINQETLMCGEGYEFTYYPTFNGPQDMGHDLVEMGFDIVGMANNHMLDKGGKGLEKTIDFWRTLDVTSVGGYYTEEDYNDIRVYEEQGIKIALLSYTYGTNGLTAAKGSNVYIPYLFEADIEKQVEAAKKVGDMVIVSVHWGEEGQFKPTSYQREYAKRFADLGVDAVIGHHPHVIQPVEWVEGKNGNKMLCVYSLGNYMAEQAYDYNMVGGMISFDIVMTGGEVGLENVVFIPTVFDFDRTFYNNRVYLLEEYTAEQAANHGIIAYGRRTSLATLRKYVSDTISPEFLPESYKAKAAS